MLVDTMVMYGADPAAPCAAALPHADMPARPVAASAGIPGLLRGSVDLLRRNLVEGWARDEAAPHQPVPLVILVDGVEVARQLACHYRADLVAAGFGSGRYGFSAVIPWLDAAKPHVVTICRASDGAQIERSPAIIHPSPYFDAALEQDVAALFESIEPGPEQERVAAFLEAQMDLLQQRRGGPRPASTNHRRVTRPSAPARPPTGPADLPGSRRAVVIDQTIPMEGDPAAQALLSHMRALQDMDYAVSFVQAQTPTHADTAAAALEDMGIGCSRAPLLRPCRGGDREPRRRGGGRLLPSRAQPGLLPAPRPTAHAAGTGAVSGGGWRPQSAGADEPAQIDPMERGRSGLADPHRVVAPPCRGRPAAPGGPRPDAGDAEP